MAKVLVVDDSLSVRKVVERALLGRQMEVVCAATGSEALERIERDEPDVVVCDVLMPDKDGYEICQFVKAHPRLARTPVLLMSGIVNDEVRARAARVRSAAVLSKPFAADDLLRKLDALLAVNTPPPPRPALAIEPAVAPSSSPTETRDRAGHGGRGDVEAVTAVPTGPLTGGPPSAGSLAPETTAPVTGSAAILKHFAGIDGVQWAVLADREGFLLDVAGKGVVDAEVAGALSACLTESSEGLGRELGRGALLGMILEYAQGMVVLYSVGPSALLAIALGEPSALGKVRYFAKRSIPELLRAV